MKIKTRISNWILRHASFPYECKSGNELDWMLKDNCPCCIGKPIEWLSNVEYRMKYPAKNKIQFGTVTVYLCDYHLKELKEELEKSEI